MKIIYFTSRVPYPYEKGDKLRAFHQLKSLSEKHEVILVSLTDEPIHTDSISNLEKYCSKVYVFKLSRVGILLNLLKVFFTGKPFQLGYFYNSSIQKKINALVDAEKPEQIFCQLIRTSEYVKMFFNIVKTLDYMDALSKGVERRISVSPVLLRPFLLSEYKRLLHYENLVFEYFEHKIIISEQDRNFIPHPRKNEIKVVPNGVDTDYFSPVQQERKYDLLFTGNMSYPPNIASALYIAHTILPELKKSVPSIRVLIAGTDPAPEIRKLQSESIHVSGWMQDIRESYNSAHLFVAPIHLGSGMQNKILEAMAMELPCVSSQLANNAIKGQHGKQVWVAVRDEDYVKHILFLLNNRDEAKKMGEMARAFVKEEYSWAKVNSTLIQMD